MKILLTGATGFIGRHLLGVLAESHDVVALARTQRPADLAEGVEWVVQDLTQPLDRTSLPERLDAVLHLAQSTRYREFPDGVPDMFAVNTHATLDLLELARESGASLFGFTSTGGVYGYSEERLAEQAPVDPLNFYLSSKYAAELLIANYGQFFATIVFRPFFVYGPGQRGMLVSNLIERVLAGDEVQVQGEPGLAVNPIFVGDCTRAIANAVERGTPGLFNLAGDQTVTLRELVEEIGRAAGREPQISHSGESPAGDLIGDNSLMKRELVTDALVDLPEGLRRTVESFQT